MAEKISFKLSLKDIAQQAAHQEIGVSASCQGALTWGEFAGQLSLTCQSCSHPINLWQKGEQLLEREEKKTCHISHSIYIEKYCSKNRILYLCILLKHNQKNLKLSITILTAVIIKVSTTSHEPKTAFATPLISLK